MATNAPKPLPDNDFLTHLAMLDLATLRPHPRNDGSHPPEELAHLRQSIREHNVYRNIVVAEDNTILAGHGVVEAAQQLGWTTVPIQRLPYPPDHPEALKVLIGDNEIERLNIRDDEQLLTMLTELRDQGIALLGSGWDAQMLANMNGVGDGTGTGEENYSRKIESPVYTPTGLKPAITSLYTRTRTEELVAEIEKADLPEEEKVFLRWAAQRHTVFNYKLIAEYYAHAEVATQRLMEDSALIIIDFNRAIELGYVQLSQNIAEQYLADENNDV